MVEEAGVEGRHPHQRRRSRHRRDHRVRIELVHVDHRRPREERDIDRHEQPVGMKNRQRVNEPVRGSEAPAVDQRQRVRRRDFRASASPPSSGRSCPRCRGSRPDRRSRAGPSRTRAARRRFASAKVPSRLTPRLSTRGRPSFRASVRTGVEPVGPAEDERGLGVAEEIFELGQRIGGVQRQQDRAGAKAGQRDHNHVGRFLDLRRDAVAGPDPERGQRMSRLRRAREKLAIGQRRGVARSRARASPGCGARAAKRSNRLAE